MAAKDPKIGIIMGSLSDWPTMKRTADVLDELGVPYEAKVVSARRKVMTAEQRYMKRWRARNA